jgi:predicted transcriptional regulator
MSLLRASSTLRGFDTTTIAPVFVEDIRNQILGGMETEILYLPETATEIVSSYPEQYRDAVDSGSLTILTDDDLPFGLALFDDRVAIGGYDDETGMLRVFVDTDDPAAYAWGEQLFRTYRERATPLTEDLSEAERN